ncbi:hypothetical protein CN582_27040 [Bacillus wiedmannii]|uniref:UPF0489 family protein n=1 Tax=Bacillus wiedmannii TaxID=1890302 RepID=UPI000BF58152|nr:UPF0489 family protein [Bacillus wiedmannii]PEP91607.1 hypothetical protein CN582_27040 [Bacillus wiedmannii]
MFAHQTIDSKDIYIVKHHHQVLEPWAIYRERNAAPILVTLDHHTDCHSAFLQHSALQIEGDRDEMDAHRVAFRKNCIDEINYNDLNTVRSAIGNLKHDEHIDAAIKSSIIEKALVISYDAHRDDPMSFKESKRIEEYNSTPAILARMRGEIFEVQAPEGYPESENSIYILDKKCWIGDQAKHPAPHNDDCTKPHYDQAIESIYLEDKLNTINEMIPGLIENNQFTQDYILDIDLDYFHTIKSIQPENCDTIYNLIRNAKIITIATEPICVENLKYGNEQINSELLLDALLNHIEQALSPTTIVE